MNGLPILSIITFLPLAGLAAILAIPKKSEELIRQVALLTTLAVFVLSIPLYTGFDSTTADMQFVEKFAWIPQFGIQYYVGIDGISLLLVLLTTFSTAICILSTWTAIEKHVKEFMISMLLLETGMIGVFVSLDFFLFYVFWEVMLIPMYFIIGIWGGGRRIYAAIKFFLFTMFGSVLMLVAILAMYFTYHAHTGEYTLEILKYHGFPLPATWQFWLFLAFFLAFAIKVPMFPFHTWLPDAHVEAPTAGSVILAGVLLKMGTYGFLRFSMPMFPDATVFFVPFVSYLALIGIIYGALVAMVQEDVKKLVAYSSVSHLGYVMLGMFALNAYAVEGSILQMINHGISTGMLFLLIGVIYERRHTRLISEFGGLTKIMPRFAVVFMIATLSSIALPGTNGFVGEFLILLGVFKANVWYAIIATTGVIFGAVYMLWMFQRVMFGPVTNDKNRNLPDLNTREWAYLAPMILFVFWIGVYPESFTSKMHVSVNNLLGTIEQSKGKNPITADKIFDFGGTVKNAADAPAVAEPTAKAATASQERTM